MKRRYLDIVYEDKDLLVVNKPRGVVVELEKGKDGSSLVKDVRSYIISKFPGAKAAFASPLHRLDKETTGLVLFAKSRAGQKLIADMKEHKVKRTYLAIVEGVVHDGDGTIRLSLQKGDFGHGKKVGVVKGGEGKETVTHFHVVERYENATMIEARLETGFTHQIRVHFANLGHPLVGDKVYNPHGKIKFPRQALHAVEILFRHPNSGKKVQLRGNPPQDMVELIDRLRGC